MQSENDLNEIERMQMAYFYFIDNYSVKKLMQMYKKSFVFVDDAIKRYQPVYMEMWLCTDTK